MNQNTILFCLVLAVFFSIAAQNLNAQNDDPLDAPLFEEGPLWRQALGGSVIGRPASQAESVVMINDGGIVNAYSWQGRPLWNYFSRGRLVPFLSRSPEGTSYVCRTNGLLIAVNRSGREIWQINLEEAITAPVLIGWDGRLFVFTPSKIHCFTASGFRLWSRPLEKKLALGPAMDNGGGFYLVLENAELLRISAFGETIALALEAVPSAILSFKPETGGPPSLILFYRGRNAEIFNIADGSRERINGFPQNVLAANAFDSFAALLQRDGRVALLSLEDQEMLWSRNTHVETAELSSGNIDAEIIFDERGIFLLTQSGATALSVEGVRLWFIKIRGTASFPSFSDEGVLYSGGTDWVLYAYRPEERVKARKRVLYGPAPEGNYGTGLHRPQSRAGTHPAYNEDEIEKTLAEIRSVLRSGQIGERELEFASRLIEIAASEIDMPRPGYGPVEIPVFFRQRCEAVRLLSFMGSRETVPFLADLFNRDKDTFVKAAAAEAMGRIGVDPEGLALNAFSQAIFPPVPLDDERTLTSIASAAGALCRFSGPPLGEAAARILVFLAAADKPPPTRREAEKELRTLSRL